MSLEYGSAMAHISISRHAASMIVQLLPDFETIFGCLLVAALNVLPIKGVMQGSACASLCFVKLDPACSNYSMCTSCMLLSQFLNLRSMLLSQLLKNQNSSITASLSFAPFLKTLKTLWPPSVFETHCLQCCLEDVSTLWLALFCVCLWPSAEIAVHCT